MLNNKDMNINELKDCIHYEVIGSERPFSWRKAIVRAIKHRRVRYLFWWRIAKYLFDKGGYCRKIAGKIERFILDKYNVTVPLTVNIGKGFDISYLNSVVIGHKVTIGENCSIKPGVTIGLRGEFNDMDIVIGHNVTIGCNATILGGKVRIGNNVTIGAHALVLHDIPDDSTFITKFQSEVICRPPEHNPDSSALAIRYPELYWCQFYSLILCIFSRNPVVNFPRLLLFQD